MKLVKSKVRNIADQFVNKKSEKSVKLLIKKMLNFIFIYLKG